MPSCKRFKQASMLIPWWCVIQYKSRDKTSRHNPSSGVPQYSQNRWHVPESSQAFQPAAPDISVPGLVRTETHRMTALTNAWFTNSLQLRKRPDRIAKDPR